MGNLIGSLFVFWGIFVYGAQFLGVSKDSAPTVGFFCVLFFIFALWLIDLLLAYIKVSKNGKSVVNQISPVLSKIDLKVVEKRSKKIEFEYKRIKSILDDHENELVYQRKRFV